jgi:hypothetical protein
VRWLFALLIVAGCKRSTPQPAGETTADAAAKAAAQAEQATDEPSANQVPLIDAAPPAPDEGEARKMVAPVYDWTRTCFKSNPAGAEEKGPFEIRMSVYPSGVVGGVEVSGRPSATPCVRDQIRQKLKLRPWTGTPMEVRLPITANGDPVYVDGGSAAR